MPDADTALDAVTVAADVAARDDAYYAARAAYFAAADAAYAAEIAADKLDAAIASAVGDNDAYFANINICAKGDKK